MSRINANTKTSEYKSILAGISEAYADEIDPEVLIDLALDGIRDTTSAVGADLLLYHLEMNILYPRKPGLTPPPWGMLDTKNNLAHEAMLQLKTQYVPDVTESGYQPTNPGARALLAIPLIVARRVHGVLYIEVPEANGLSDEDIAWVDIIASMLSAILEMVHLNEVIFDLHREIINQMSTKAGEKDPSYAGHADRVSAYAVAIAEEMHLPQRVVTDVGRSGYLHDIGKLGVSPVILTKPGKLTDDEFEEVKKHTVLGRFLLKPLGFMPGVLEGIAAHHERWDGGGYPKGLKGEHIPIEGRILAVAEAFDSMTTDLPYRKAMPSDDAIAELKTQSGSQFDPDVVDALCTALESGLELK